MLEGSPPPLCHLGQRNFFNPRALLRDTGSSLEAALVTGEGGRGVCGGDGRVLASVAVALTKYLPNEDVWRTEH